MAITSLGYGGQITETDLPLWAHALGGIDYGVRDEGSWKVSAVSVSTRTVQVAPGRGFGKGVIDTSDSVYQVTLPNPVEGTRWYLIVCRRNTSGAGGTTQFTRASDTGASTPAVAMSLRHTYETTAKVTDDQPLALVRVTKDNPVVQQIIDVRCWQANGGAAAAGDEVQWYLNRIGTTLTMPSGVTWTRIIDPTGEPAWLAHQPDPKRRKWSNLELSSRSWGPNAWGNMVGVTVTGAPAGEYLIFANAVVHRVGAVEAPGALIKDFIIDDATVTGVQDDIVGNVWVDRAHTVATTRATAGAFNVVYRIHAGAQAMSVKHARITALYLGAIA